MKRRRALRRLYSMHRTEWNFGWHDPNPVTREACRKEWPVEVVAEFHKEWSA
jgi:hypothetical protein